MANYHIITNYKLLTKGIQKDVFNILKFLLREKQREIQEFKFILREYKLDSSKFAFYEDNTNGHFSILNVSLREYKGTLPNLDFIEGIQRDIF